MPKSKIILAAPTHRKVIIYLDIPVKKRACPKFGITSSSDVFFDQNTLKLKNDNHQLQVRASGLEELVSEVDVSKGKEVKCENNTNDELLQEKIIESASRSLLIPVDENFKKQICTIIEAGSLSKRKQQLDELFKNLSALHMPSEPNLTLAKVYNKEVLAKIVTIVFLIQFDHYCYI